MDGTQLAQQEWGGGDNRETGQTIVAQLVGGGDRTGE